MPEKFSRPLDGGFISLWEIDEPVSFFETAVDPAVLQELSGQHSEKRLLQKLVPHHILALHHEHITINNIDRKPVASRGHVSISHCGHMLALYYHAAQPVGIDIEAVQPKVLRIRHKFMSPAELEFCGDDIEKCLFVWAIKESVFKKHGNETAFFAENILVSPFEPTILFETPVQVRVNHTLVTENMRCELINGLVMAHTL